MNVKKQLSFTLEKNWVKLFGRLPKLFSLIFIQIFT